MREFELLKHVYASNPRLGSRVEVPPGDDLAMVRLDGRNLLAGVDQLVEGIHFKLNTTPIEQIGRKAVARSLSDIAAMAGIPIATLAAVTLPADFGSARATALFDAMRLTADAFHSPLIGGDIAIDPQPAARLVCSVTVLAEPGHGGPVTRGGAQIGDTVAVSGSLGGSFKPDGSGRHLTFEPRIGLARSLAGLLGHRLHAMIDLSDGLGRDASHIAEQSGVTIMIDSGRLPCTDGCSWREALGMGEDYELCFAARRPIPREIDGVPITIIGEVVRTERQQPHIALVRDGDRAIPVNELGWQHTS
jgi:thiamine-monophosphate kinase